MDADGHPIRHGGDPAALARAFPDAPRPWLDLSTGINPLPWPVGPIPPASWARLPLPGELATLRDVAAAAYGAPGAAFVAPAPGTQILIGLLPRLRPPGRVAVVGRTYGEHAPAWRAAGHRVATVPSVDRTDGADVVVVVNPNNPDGRTVEPAVLLAVAADLAERGGLLVVDEAFADVRPDVSVASAAGRPGLVVLRSFGKFHGLAGLRLGFALSDAATTGAILAALGPWAVSGPALHLGSAALADADWTVATRVRLGADAARLDGIVRRAGAAVLGGTDLFRLVRVADGASWIRRLGAAGIHVRVFDEVPDEIRFGLPGPAADWRRLAAALGTTAD
jgi:cobalamin biosynthetic protein CobC